MNKLRIKFDFSHGPIWKEKYDFSTKEWSTGIKVVDNDKALNVLNSEAEREYSSLYSFDDDGLPRFDKDLYECKKEELLSLVQTIILRLNEINDGTYTVIDEETKNLV